MSPRRLVAVVCALAVALSLAATADAGKKKKRKLNMPAGWEWPPSRAMKESGAECMARLDQLGVTWKKAPRARKVTNPIELPTMELGGIELEPIWRKPPFVMDCYLAMAIATIAPELRKLGVARLRFSTIHDYRFVRKKKKTTNILSRHALGLAMDVYEIVTDDGEVHVVAKHYRRGDSVLRAVEKVAANAGVFRALLTPGNDRRSHHDHFHFEAAMPIPGAKIGWHLGMRGDRAIAAR